jgi:hypothetical protein
MKRYIHAWSKRCLSDRGHPSSSCRGIHGGQLGPEDMIHRRAAGHHSRLRGTLYLDAAIPEVIATVVIEREAFDNENAALVSGVQPQDS